MTKATKALSAPNDGGASSLLVPPIRLYLALPHRGAQGAEVRAYAVQ
jgi:hypothetical protein